MLLRTPLTKRFAVTLLLISAIAAQTGIVLPSVHAQTLTAAPAKAAPVTSTTPTSLILKSDTPVKLRLGRTLSSGTERLGDKVDFKVLENVKINGVTVIKQDAVAIGTITKAKKKASFGRSGSLDVNIDSVELANGSRANLRAVQGGAGGGRKGVVTAGIVASAVLLWPAAPAFFFIKGKNITIPQGTEVTAYIAADTQIDGVVTAN